MNITITGYYSKQNLGDDLFEYIARKIFKNCRNIKYNIIPIDNINLPENRNNIDRIILFGGETLNNYFIDKLINMKKYNPNIKYSAICVSCNQSYDEITNKLNIFEYVLFRSYKDYTFYKNYLNCDYAPDMVFSLNKKIVFMKKNIVGFFLSQTSVYSLTKDNEYIYIKNITQFIRFLIKQNFYIYLFPMCTNNKNSEDDNYINSKIYNYFTEYEKKYIKIFISNNKILSKIKKIKYAVCWRFHAHILSIINTIPFISLSNTPKVMDLLKYNHLCDLHSNENELINKFNYIRKNESLIKNKLKNIYSKLHNDTSIYFDKTIYLKNKNENQFYIEPLIFDKIYDYIKNNYNKNFVKFDLFHIWQI